MRLSNKPYAVLGNVPVGIGAILHGWDVAERQYRDPASLCVVDFRAMSPACPHDCFHCFTDKLRKTLTLPEIKTAIDQLAEMGVRGIDYLGEGEPTINKDFFPIIEHTASRGIVPIIFTDAATMMRDTDFIQRVKDCGASVVPKCDSLWSREYQNWVVRDKTGRFFDERNEALELLIKEGFNEVMPDGTTRLGFDMVVSSRNTHEVEHTLRFCRENNLWVVFAFYIPAGRSDSEDFDKALVPSCEQKKAMRQVVQRVDEEYGHKHGMWNNFATGPCVERLQIYGDGRISTCPGNEKIIGYVQTDSIREVHSEIIRQFPKHDPRTFDGNCPYRDRV